VRNLLAVDPKAPRASSEIIRGAIERALERHAEHSAKRVQITISDGTVVLTGEVPSWAERVAVEGAVRGTPGVWRVESQLRIHS
jgi:osmotically-inducible protein OsmY